jgi:aminoglycoside phosphotransferase (APT) family kinase protein
LTDALVPQPVVDLLALTFPGAPIGDAAPTFGGFSNRTAALTIGGQRCVVKAADTPLKREDVRPEARVLELLRGSGLPCPALLALAESEAWTVAVQRAVPGDNGLSFLNGAPHEIERIFPALGQLLAAIHELELAARLPELSIAERARQTLAALPDLATEADLHAELALSLAHPAWQPPPARLVHGDAGLHNILWDGHITALLDWEWSGWGNALLDLAWVFWTIRWRGLPDHLWQALLWAYRSHRHGELAGAAATLRALALGQIAGILIRVQRQSAAREEWLRRARWTLSLTFPDIDPR